MKIGLLARADERGIAHQTREFWLHMRPHATLVMLLQDPAWPEDPGKYGRGNADFVYVDRKTRLLDPRKARKLARAVDVIFAVESLMDWDLTEIAHQEHCRTVVQGNPEFYLHGHKPLPHPDKWVWPTPWLRDELPGDVLPVPVPDEPPTLAAPHLDGPLRVLHVAGHAAAGDRNGTLDFMEAVGHVRTPMEVTVVGQDGWLPKCRPSNKVTLHLNPHGVADRWEMYKDQHVIVLPRKYGGLCLPAQEAARCGLAVVMPDCSPNEIWPGPRLRARKGRLHHAPKGRIQTWNVDPREIASTLDSLNNHRGTLGAHMEGSRAWADAHTWRALRPLYAKTLV